MRAIVILVAGLTILAGNAAHAAVSILVDKDNQQMTVSVDGEVRYTWPVSSGDPAHETPNGSFRTFRMEEDHYSKEFDDAPMPNAIFFTRQGHAIHGTDSVNRLGTPASHGCVRLSRANALKLWDLVKQEGLLNTTVTLKGSAQVAVARLRSRTKVARRNGAVDENGQPLQIAPGSSQSSYSEDIDGNAQSQHFFQNRTNSDEYAQNQTYNGSSPAFDPGPMQRRIYQNNYGYQNGYGYQDNYAYQRRYYGPRGY